MNARNAGDRELSTAETLPSSFGRYQVIEELGQGSMGIVYLCVDPRLARPVAIKVLKETDRPPDEAERFFERFRREAEAAGRLHHPGIVQIYDVGPSYIVMEFLEGQTLAQVLDTGGSFNGRKAASLVLRVADALDYAHERGVVHRDVKPANIMLMGDGGVKVMDYGVARLEASQLTAAGTVVGSYRYMSPEQMMGEAVDGRADVFSLATIAYELLTGQTPFPAKTITEIVSRVVNGNHIPPRQVESRIPPGLDGVFACGFAPKLEARFPRAMDFARAFYQEAQPILDLDFVHEAREAHEASRAATEVDAGTRSFATRSGFVTVTRGGGEALLAKTAPGQREGVLMLDSDPPGALVYVDGNPVGEAPVSGVEVGFGRHVVRMEVPDRTAISAEVDVDRERPLMAVAFTLPSQPAGAAVTSGQFVPLGPDVTPPRRLSGAAPGYPESARERGLEGEPVVELWINELGDVMDVAIVRSAGALLDDALLQAVTAWRFAPAMLGGVPVSVRMTVQHLFRR